MPNRILLLWVTACLTSAAWAADELFVGHWKVNASASKLIDEMTVEAVGANKYTFAFGPGTMETIVADGTDQPALGGSTLSITVKGANRWEVVRKIKGRLSIKADWTLSGDGKTLNDAFTQYLPDGFTLFSQPLPNGSSLIMPYEYARSSGSSGFVGTWDSESAKVKAGLELVVQAYEGGGLTFKRSDEESVERFTLDGTDHPVPETNRGGQSTYAGRRINDGSLEITYKSQGKATGTRLIELSSGLKVLTVTDRAIGQLKPKSVLVFDRE